MEALLLGGHSHKVEKLETRGFSALGAKHPDQCTQQRGQQGRSPTKACKTKQGPKSKPLAGRQALSEVTKGVRKRGVVPKYYGLQSLRSTPMR